VKFEILIGLITAKGRGAAGRLASIFGALVGVASAASGAAPLSVGFERFQTGKDANLIEAGELLIGELGCVNCHQVSGDLVDRFPTRQAPLLDGIGARVNHDWLVAWLASPHATKAGTVMPDLLAGRKAKSRKSLSEGLAHFLISLGGDSKSLDGNGDAASGRKLYHTVGCVACHQPEPGYSPEGESAGTSRTALGVPSVPLGNLGAKHGVASLAAFLRDPLKTRPSARMPKVPLSEAEAADLARYLIAEAGAPQKKIKPGGLKKRIGKSAFASLGCAACHRVEVGGKAIESKLTGKPLAELPTGSASGCLSSRPLEKVPFYDLSAGQRAAVAAALKHLPTAAEVSFAERSNKLMTALNCFACHQRGEIGGPEDGRKIYFHTTGQDLEDEGRFPPLLTGAGRKLRPEAMVEIIQGKGAVRPYMSTRMPDFGEAHARELALMFPTLDIPKNETPTPRNGVENKVGRNMWGRALLGAKGLSCIACHDLNGTKSLGIRAMDLAHAQSRLRPEWFRDYLIDPAKFRPGTRMPSFWPEGKPILKGNGGATSRQIDSIWVYLNEVDQSRLPEGLEKKGNFELKPTDKPIVLRTFMETAGLHAIAVGYPGGMSAAFDSKNVHWSLFWKGRFLDAESTWDDRFTPLAKPLGESVVKPATKFPFDDTVIGFTPVNREGAVEKKKPVFRGYRKDSRGNPTMVYSYAGLEIEDTLTPSKDGKSVRQNITLAGPSGFLTYNMASGLTPKLISHKGGLVKFIDKDTSDAEVGAFLRIVTQPPDNKTTLILEWTW
jgi:cytochrome c551/c552